MKPRFADANGLRFEVFEAGEVSADKFAICLHGFPEHAHSWRHQIPVLVEQGYHVWAPNLRGYGESSKPPRVVDYVADTIADDVVALIRERQARAGSTGEVVLLGHDWGAMIAWNVAFRFAELIDRLVIMNVPHPAIFARTLRTSAAQRKASWYMGVFQIPGLPEAFLKARGGKRIRELFSGSSTNPDAFSDADLDVYAQNFMRPGAATAMINYYRAALRYRKRATEIRQIDVPTLMLWGEADIALMKETTYGTEEFVPNLTLRYLPGISHWVQQDAPATVNAMLSAWLADLPVPEADAVRSAP